MKLFRSLIRLAVLAGVCGGVAFAQNRTVFAGAANAFDFAYGVTATSPAPLQVDLAGGPSAVGVATLTVSFGNTTLGDGTVIAPLSTSAPVTVGTGANAETVTPSAVSCTTPNVYQSCSFTATFTNQHGTGDRVSSASNGLDEAALFLSGKGGGLVLLSPTWFGRYASHAAGITALTGQKSVSAVVTVLDYSGIPGVFSYNAAAASNYASTTHVIY